MGKASIAFTKQIRRFVRRHAAEDLRVVYTATTVGSYLGLKDAIPQQIKPRVLYKFTCLSDSDASYIGYSKRLLVRRFKEHRKGRDGRVGKHRDLRRVLEHEDNIWPFQNTEVFRTKL